MSDIQHCPRCGCREGSFNPVCRWSGHFQRENIAGSDTPFPGYPHKGYFPFPDMLPLLQEQFDEKRRLMDLYNTRTRRES